MAGEECAQISRAELEQEWHRQRTYLKSRIRALEWVSGMMKFGLSGEALISEIQADIGESKHDLYDPSSELTNLKTYIANRTSPGESSGAP